MKKLLLLIFLIPVLVSAQKTTGANYTYIAQRYEWLAGVFKALGLPAGSGPAAFTAGQEMRAGAIYYDSLGIDSGLYVWSGLAWNKQGSEYTDADARSAISLTTTGTSGAATYSSATGVFNIPNYGSATGKAPYQSGVVVEDKGRYDAFPIAFTKEDTIFVASINASNHSGPGYATIYRSLNGGMNYDSLTVGTDSLVSGHFAGQFDDTTTTYAFNGSDLQRLYFRRSVDGLQSFQTTDSIILTGDNKGIIFAAPGIHLPSGKFLFPAYFFNTVTSTYSSELIATDDGIDFYRYGVIYSGSTNKNEASFEFISGSTDGTSTIIAMLRSQSNSYPEQYISTNGGVTFTLQGSVTAFGTEVLSPTYIKKWNGRIYLIKGVRSATSTVTAHIGISEATIAQAVVGVSSWSTGNSIYDSRTDYKTAAIDFGYTTPFEYDNQLLLTFYDIAPNSPVTPSTTRTTRMVSMKVFNHSGYERHNRTNQTITTGVTTAVNFTSILYDADNSWNSADTCFIFKRDGWYQIQASFTYPTDTTGTYRQGLLKVVEPFLNTTAANQLLDKVTITGSDNLDFNRIKLAGLVFIQAGMKLKVFAKHDATTSQDLANTDIETRAKIYIKRIE